MPARYRAVGPRDAVLQSAVVMRCAYLLGVVAVLAAGCSDDGTSETGLTGDGTTGSNTVNTTLPVTSETITTSPGDATGADTGGSTGASTSAGADAGTSDSTGASDGSSTSASTTTGDPETGSSTGSEGLFVEWCNLQFPPTIMVAAGVPTTAYARLYIAGVTDASVFIDEHPQIEAEFGYGADGSNPDDTWTWVTGVPNKGWDGSMAKGGFGNENNDEYQADISFADPGVFDYAARFSGDNGETWEYCDLDGLTKGGYTADQAGDANITE